MRGLAVNRLLPMGVRLQSTLPSAQSKSHVTLSSSAESIEKPIKIPMRIKRGPADILKALASTVGHDETAAHYKFHDDPFLIPSNPLQRRRFAMCKEAGRKAALYFATKFPTLFMYDQDEPRIESFRPVGRPDPSKPLPADKINEATLLEYIDKGWMQESIKLYRQLKQQQKKSPQQQPASKKGSSPSNASPSPVISRETQLKLLEFFCFHNCQEPVETEFQESTFHRTYFSLDQSLKSEWNSGGEATELFSELEPKDLRVYTALIRGMVKYSAYDDAYQAYESMRRDSPHLQPNLHIYNAILRCAFELKMKPQAMWDFVEDVLKQMALRKMRPNLHTFNAILSQLDRAVYWNLCSEKCLAVLREMKEMKIDPSPATLYYFLHINEKKEDKLGSYVDFVLTYVESQKSLKMADPADNMFYHYCMQIIAKKLQNKTMAYRLHANLLRGDNHLLLNDADHETEYYHNLLSILSTYEDSAKFLDFYDGLVPHIANPSYPLMQDIIENIELNGCQYLLPRIYPSLLAGGYLKSGFVVAKFVNAMFHATDNVDFDTKRKFADIAYDIKVKVDSYIEEANQKQAHTHLYWTPVLLSRISRLCEKAGQIERSQLVAKAYAELVKNNNSQQQSQQ